MTSSLLNIDICVCTFRRPHILDTLKAVAALAPVPNAEIKVIVADNDEIPSAKAIVQKFADNSSLALTYVHAPSRNISIARNACLKASTGDLIAFLDDDELPALNWLTSLVERKLSTGADVVLGPVRSIYPGMSASWLQQNDFHSIKPVWVKGQIVTGYTSNVIFDRKQIERLGLSFNLDLGRSGGEDTAFFAALHANGLRFEFATEAIVTERVSTERLTFEWVLRRYFRSGQTHARLVTNSGRSAWTCRMRVFSSALAKASFCGVMALFAPHQMRFWMARGALHLGAVAYTLGKPELIQYG